jgi:HK97 family phage portal protein
MNARTIAARRRAAVRVRRAVNKSDAVWDRDDAWRLITGGGPTDAGVSVTHRSALGYPPLWRATNLIANAVGKLPLYAYKRGEQDSRERAKTHAAYPLLRRKPNPLMTAGVFKRTLTLQAQLDGNGYAWIERNGFGDAIALWPLQPSDTYPVVECVGLVRRLWYITRDSEGRERKVAPRDILHIKGPTYDGYMGLSVLEIMKEALGLGMAARKFATLFFGQGLNARGFLMVPHRLSDTELQKLREQWPKMEAGLSRSHLPVVLHGGLDFKPTQVNPDKAQALQTRQFEVREVSNITGVPPHYLGDDSRTSYNSLEMESQSFLDNAVDPWLLVWEEECDDKLLSEEEKESESHYVEFLRDALLRVDAKTQTDINYRERESGVSSVNDILKRKNRPPIGPEGDVRHVPQNWGILTAEAPAEQAPADEGQSAEQLEAALRNLAEHQAGLLVRSEADQVLRAAKRESNFVNWMVRYYEAHERKIATALAPVLRVVNPGGDPSSPAAKLALEHVRASREELLAATDGDPAGFVGRIEVLTARWESDRAATLAANILGA